MAEKSESQEICFVPDGNYAGFIDRYLEAEGAADRLPGEGEIVDAERRGDRPSCGHSSLHDRPATRDRHCRGRNLFMLSRSTRRRIGWWSGIRTICWAGSSLPPASIGSRSISRQRARATPRCACVIATRPRQPPSRRSTNDRVRVVFDEPQRAITPGQATVFYRGDEVVGGGWIVKSGGRGRSSTAVKSRSKPFAESFRPEGY